MDSIDLSTGDEPVMKGNADTNNDSPSIARASVFQKTQLQEEDKNLFTHKVNGFNFDNGIDYHGLLQSFRTTGFQATNVSMAIDIINEMWLSRREQFAEDFKEEDQFIQRRSGCTIFLGYTSNIVSSGLRDIIRFLVQHKMVDCIVTTAGGIEEDLIKCLAPFYLGDFNLKGSDLREKGINRIGNLLVPNENYCKFEDWIIPILSEMLKEQQENGMHWTPSKIINRLGEKINNKQSIYYWAAVNKIPVFCPGLTDGSLGDMVYFHSFKESGLIIDIAADIRRINTIAVKAQKSGMVIIGGGIIKHHICNANLMRNGADYSVFINTANEFDGSDAGARPDEAVSWGKIKSNAKSVKVNCDATIVFPLIVAETFARFVHSRACKSSEV
ncbi:probable deoxyhypusine synthase [Tetranychus urticae]|uniref:deoxyhypusine synthase n=1 Tax=Tetranychus urticae TaxID=32264 RepID=T1KZG9_TETUR|nr:probable deoxyhypusine synthase [Tetranychus urticae]